MTTKEITAKVHELKELKLMAEELEAQITTIEDEIKAEMTAQNINEIVLGIFKVRWTKVVSSRFDSKAFKETHASLYDQYCKPVESKRFSVA